MSRIAIVGGGLAGSLLALRLSRLHPLLNINVFEGLSRSKAHGSSYKGQSHSKQINLALSSRGWRALNKVSLEEEVKTFSIPMAARRIHHQDSHYNQTQQISEKNIQYYDPTGHCLWSVSRQRLAQSLASRAEQQSNVTYHFNKSLHAISEEVSEGNIHIYVLNFTYYLMR